MLEVAEGFRRLQSSKSKTSVCIGIIRIHSFFLVKLFEEKTAVQHDLFTWPFLVCLERRQDPINSTSFNLGLLLN